MEESSIMGSRRKGNKNGKGRGKQKEKKGIVVKYGI